MAVTLVIPTGIEAELRAAALGPLETAGVLLVTTVQTPDASIRLLAREIRWVEENAYARREADGLSIRSEGYVHALGAAERMGATAIWLHTHPGTDSSPTPSAHDKIVDSQIGDLFRIRTGMDYYGAIVISPRPGGLAFEGHLDARDGPSIKIDRLWLVGDRLRLVKSQEVKTFSLSPAHDRNVRAFGPAVQATLNDLHVGIVGCGGTGSVIAEQLVRLGVRQFTLFDPDELSESNVTRVYGSTFVDVGRAKIDVLGAHLSRVASDVRVEALKAAITEESIARRLTECDVLFGCTDDNAGRLVLSRTATYFLTPVIDCGVVLTSANQGQLTGIDGRVTLLTPGEGCLVCRGRIDLARAAAEVRSTQEQGRLTREGYAPALGGIEPAVVTFTTAVGAVAVSELLERLIGYGPEPRPSEILLRCHEREMSTNRVSPREGHYCHPQSGKMGAGITRPYLDQSWPT